MRNFIFITVSRQQIIDLTNRLSLMITNMVSTHNLSIVLYKVLTNEDPPRLMRRYHNLKSGYFRYGLPELL